MSDFSTKLSRYAQLLVIRGMNVENGDEVQVNFEGSESEELALLVAEQAYQRGAKHVHLAYRHPKLIRAKIGSTDSDSRIHYPSYESNRFDHLVESGGCYLDIRSNPCPTIFDSVSDRIDLHQSALKKVRGRFFSHGINKGLITWCIACVPSVQASAMVYPHLNNVQAVAAFWEAVFRMTMCQDDQFLSRWENCENTLKDRVSQLNTANLSSVRFIGPETDLTVGLCEESCWVGGSKKSGKGKMFTANVPSYEVYSTPNRIRTEGWFRSHKPLVISGVIVEKPLLEFSDGKVVRVESESNVEVLRKHLAIDEGASYLGEVALVTSDSPIAKENTVFYNTVFDENASCHVATGMGYSAGIKDGWSSNEAELLALGKNTSTIHDDIMINSMEVSGVSKSGSRVSLIKDGKWVM